MDIQLTSSAFGFEEMIPKKYSCDGDNVSPPLSWDNIPDGAKSITLICEDPDAPMGTFIHWVLYNLPSDVNELQENVPDDETLKNEARQGVNDFGNLGYGGPCPPSGTHRYFFRIYALDKMIDTTSTIDKKTLQKEMEGHIIAKGELMGKYQRQK